MLDNKQAPILMCRKNTKIRTQKPLKYVFFFRPIHQKSLMTQGFC